MLLEDFPRFFGTKSSTGCFDEVSLRTQPTRRSYPLDLLDSCLFPTLMSSEDILTAASPEPRQVVAVIGAGAFGTAMAQVTASCGNLVRIFARKDEVVQSINEKHVNPHYLSEFTLHENITATSSLPDALDGVSFVILAIPTQLVSVFVLNYCYIADLIADD